MLDVSMHQQPSECFRSSWSIEIVSAQDLRLVDVLTLLDKDLARKPFLTGDNVYACDYGVEMFLNTQHLFLICAVS